MMLVSPPLKIQLSGCVTEIRGGGFDENTVRSLYIHVREHAKPNPLTRDLGDFFAHPERNQGITRSIIQPTVEGILKFARGESATFTVASRNIAEIFDDLNVVLTSMSIVTLPKETELDFGLVLFLAMQGMRIQISKQLIVPLSFGVLGDSIAVSAHVKPDGNKPTFVFPVFEMPNYRGFPVLLNPEPMADGWPLIKSRLIDGKRELYQEAEPIVVDFSKKP